MYVLELSTVKTTRKLQCIFDSNFELFVYTVCIIFSPPDRFSPPHHTVNTPTTPSTHPITSKKRKIPKSETTKNSLTCYIQCEICAKWRDLRSRINIYHEQDISFNCSLLPGYNCQVPEDKSVSDLQELVYKHGTQKTSLVRNSISSVSVGSEGDSSFFGVGFNKFAKFKK